MNMANINQCNININSISIINQIQVYIFAKKFAPDFYQQMIHGYQDFCQNEIQVKNHAVFQGST